MKKLLSILMLAFVIGCNKPSGTITSGCPVISAETLQQDLYDALPPGTNIRPIMMLRDTDYKLPSREWVQGEFTERLRKFLFDNNLRTFRDLNNDCDKFTLYGHVVGAMLNAHAEAGSAMAVGECAFLGLDGAHSLNFFVISEGGRRVVIFYEPQELRIVNLPVECAVLGFFM